MIPAELLPLHQAREEALEAEALGLREHVTRLRDECERVHEANRRLHEQVAFLIGLQEHQRRDLADLMSQVQRMRTSAYLGGEE